jgi:hypothetical protein
MTTGVGVPRIPKAARALRDVPCKKSGTLHKGKVIIHIKRVVDQMSSAHIVYMGGRRKARKQSRQNQQEIQ